MNHRISRSPYKSSSTPITNSQLVSRFQSDRVPRLQQSENRSLTAEELEKAAQFSHNLANIPISSPYLQDSTIQAKLTTNQKNQQDDSRHQKISRSKAQHMQTKKPDTSEVEFHQAVGKQIVATYRLMDRITSQIQKCKNREALKSAAIGFGKAGLTIGSMFTGIPGLIEGLPS